MGIDSFRQAMEIISKGEGWEDSYLVDKFPSGEFGSGTIVDVGLLAKSLRMIDTEAWVFISGDQTDMGALL